MPMTANCSDRHVHVHVILEFYLDITIGHVNFVQWTRKGIMCLCARVYTMYTLLRDWRDWGLKKRPLPGSACRRALRSGIYNVHVHVHTCCIYMYMDPTCMYMYMHIHVCSR